MVAQSRGQETLDETDRQILAILQDNARTSNAEIGRQVGKASSAVYERIRKLEESGVIEGYEARISPQAVGLDILAFVLIDKQHGVVCGRPEEDLVEVPGIQEVHIVAGEHCYLVKARAASIGELQEIINDRIPALESVSSTNTIVVLKTAKESTRLPIEKLATVLVAAQTSGA